MCKTECETFAALQDNKHQSKSLQLAICDSNEQNEMNHLIPSLIVFTSDTMAFPCCICKKNAVLP